MRALFFALLLAVGPPASAHEVRPAFLQLREVEAGEFEVLWKTPMRGDYRLSLAPELSGAVAVTPVESVRAGDAAVQTWRVRADELRGQSIRVAGLEATMTDALVNVAFADGTTWTRRLTPGDPAAVIPARQSASEVAGVYVRLGIEHILLGADHVLFVLSLLLVTWNARALVQTITAFTVAHSVTLALSTLGAVRVPSAPVEAVIALSIVFVAAEIVRARRGHPGLAARAPWIVAFAFGLLHGFGFAGALSEIGLPEGQIPVALLFFNVGVEVGQLVFVGAVSGALVLTARLRARLPSGAELVPPYAIGALATFWVIQRITTF